MAPIYTKKGDAGTTSLNPYRRKISKHSARVEALGAVDELNSLLGAARAFCQDSPKLKNALKEIQNQLQRAQAELAVVKDAQAQLRLAVGDPNQEKQSAPPRIVSRHVRQLEVLIDMLAKKLPPLTKFLLPGGSVRGAWLMYIRAVSRRAERRLVRLAEAEPVSDQLLKYFNRLSDALFMLSRYANYLDGVAEEYPDYYESARDQDG